MFWTFLLLAFAGALVALFLSLIVFARSTNRLQNFETMQAYGKLNAFFMYASLILITVVSFLLTVPGGDWLIKYLSGNQLDGTTPFQFYLMAFLTGLLIHFIIDKIRGIVKPVQLDTRTLPKPESTVPSTEEKKP